jgi:hypothetical protein
MQDGYVKGGQGENTLTSPLPLKRPQAPNPYDLNHACRK